jgi:aspartate/methionine/tyrosine aminotransferase/uncharacterized membrane protein/nitrite reductase/ring-hydroxylating ferredoxin subunit
LGVHLDTVPWSGIVRIRDMMFSVKDPFRLDQGDVSFDAPGTVKDAMSRAIAENKTHYLMSTGLPRLRELMAEKMRKKNGIPVGEPDEVMVTNGGIHALYVMFQAVLEPGDEVLLPDPVWPPTAGHIIAAQAKPVFVPLRESLGWRYDLDELRRAITPNTSAIYINSPHNPTGGVLTREDIAAIADMARQHDLWVFADEAYEDVLFNGEHVSIGSLPDMYERTIPMFTMSKSYAMTGVRIGYLAVKDAAVRDRCKKILLYTTSNVCSIAQFGAIGALEGSQACIGEFATELRARRDFFYDGIRSLGGVFTGEPPNGAFYAFLRINPEWEGARGAQSLSWAMTEHLIKHGRIGCVPGVDFGAAGEGHIRFCFARERKELTGALDSMRQLFGVTASAYPRSAIGSPLAPRQHMRTKASYSGHPIHPMLIPFPFAFLTGALFFDLVAWWTGNMDIAYTGRHLTLAGVAMGLVAAIPGAIDYFASVPPQSSAKDRATKHALANVSAIVLFAISYMLRQDGEATPATLAAEFVGVVLLSMGGYMGGTLVNRNQIGVDHRYADAGKWQETTVERTSGPVVIADADDLTVDQMKLVHVSGSRIALGRTDEGYAAFDDRCTHKGGPLADGTLICGTVQCPWHGSQFDVKSGKVKCGPAKKAIGTHTLEESNGQVRLVS